MKPIALVPKTKLYWNSCTVSFKNLTDKVEEEQSGSSKDLEKYFIQNNKSILFNVMAPKSSLLGSWHEDNYSWAQDIDKYSWEKWILY